MSDLSATAVEPRTTSSLFEEPYWLDSVAPGEWAAVEIKRNGRLVGRLPYALKRRFGMTAISTPSYTPWLGPWIAPSGAKTANEIGHQHTVLNELVQGLPHAQRVVIPCAPEVTNLMALYWAGYSLELGYTYRIEALDDERTLWGELRDKVRNNCRKAEKVTSINTERCFADVLPVLDKTYRRQGLDLSAGYPALERIDATMTRRNQRKIYAAEDAKGRIHAFVYVVFDDRHSFYLAGGGDPELRESGAQALAMWHAIKGAGCNSSVFDFEGSMIPGIEHFVRGFGPVQRPRYFARRDSTSLQLAEALARLPRALLRR